MATCKGLLGPSSKATPGPGAREMVALRAATCVDLPDRRVGCKLFFGRCVIIVGPP